MCIISLLIMSDLGYENILQGSMLSLEDELSSAEFRSFIPSVSQSSKLYQIHICARPKSLIYDSRPSRRCLRSSEK